MSDLILEPTAAALWQRLIREGASDAGQPLDDELEAYLMMLLQRFHRRPELARTIMALEYLKAQTGNGGIRAGQLRDVGDQCLLFAGLFPGIARRRRVGIDYFVDLGRTAYLDLAGALSQGAGQLFHALAAGFVTLMDTLSAMRARPAFEALGALDQFELWSRTGSRGAREALARHTRAIPVAPPHTDTRH
ncbi:hypothetical protein [Acidihalobacter prosperus]|uniref:Uncharacterized protein n=1 Tax=Acidihalobacter prosperus TaxID=160660 RepID=A0A1A6C493_9GAMM|nr:hypothetical protein [Acidihalobacter prosperus]OBS09383.1 hypothetical protein Thpro_021711 [Acidihalobacter prosperus]